ncbi:MAG: DUF2807 domain-containing protein [Bacteroidales bacterium]|nr:DUF2807 domain-containing protein [Bacteroidales bacterium]
MKDYLQKSINAALLATLVLTLNSGCIYGINGVKGDGNVVKEERKVSGFDQIKVGGAFKVFLTQGDVISVVVEADENLMNLIETEVSMGKLKISTKDNINNPTALNIYITFKDLTAMDISGACELKGRNRFTLGNLDLGCSGASDIDLAMEAGDVTFDFSGASSVDLEGSANRVDLDISGASNLDAEEFSVKVLDADVSGASHARIRVSDELSADVSGAGSLKYKGEPRIRQQDVSGAGSIKSIH